jgi:hypothetical protein
MMLAKHSLACRCLVLVWIADVAQSKGTDSLTINERTSATNTGSWPCRRFRVSCFERYKIKAWHAKLELKLLL